MIRGKRNDAYGRQTLRVDCCGWESYREAVSYIACHHGSSLPLWISEMSITSYIRKGKLGAIRLGRSYRITSSDLELFIESNRLCKPASSVEPSQS